MRTRAPQGLPRFRTAFFLLTLLTLISLPSPLVGGLPWAVEIASAQASSLSNQRPGLEALAGMRLPKGSPPVLFEEYEAQSGLYAEVQGTVTDRLTGLPVPGAVVAASDLRLATATDVEGRFAWHAIPLTQEVFSTTITISAPGFGVWTMQNVRLHAADTLLLTADLGASPTLIVAPPPQSDLPNWPPTAQTPSGLEALGLDQTHVPLPATIRVRVTGWPYCDTHRPYTVETLDFRTYVKHVLPNEWGASWHREALRAGAMAAKMYAWYWVARGGKWPDADVYDSTCDQVYNPNIAYASTNAAVDDTWNWRLMKDNALVPTYYRAYYSQCVDAGLAGRCMGQWDSKDMADAGATWDQILYAFYEGAAISPAPPAFIVPLPPVPPSTPDFALRFHGQGVGDIDRLKIAIDNPNNDDPGPPADVGATDFTIEWWMKANAAENTAGAVACGYNGNWIYGNILLDRDRFNQDRKLGVSLAGGKLVFGVTGAITGTAAVTDTLTICSSEPVADGNWHHVAVTRRRLDGFMQLWVDGKLGASGDGPEGDVSYPDEGVPGDYCGATQDQPCTDSDPYLVFGAEKHDAGPAYPSFSGWLDEVRLSNVLRYTSAFTPTSHLAVDANTVALYHFDDPTTPGPCSGLVRDSSLAPGGPSHGACNYGGSPAGPEWVLSDIPRGPARLYLPLILNSGGGGTLLGPYP